MGQRRVMGEMSARAAVAFFELCSFNCSRCLVGGVDWHSLRVQRVGRCMVQLGGTIALLLVEQIWVGTESASREMICWNQRREMLRWQSSENHLRRLPPRDWRRSAMSSSAGAPSRAAHPLPLPSSSRRPLALACARALEPSADSRVLRFVCLHSFRTPACRQMPQPSPPLPLLLSTCAVASVTTGTLTLERARPPSQLTYAYAC